MVLLVFREEQWIVHSEQHFRYHGDFTPVPAIQPVPRDRAVFKVEHAGHASGGEPWLKLKQE